MHLGNSIICPVTGIPMLALMGGAAYMAFKKGKKDLKKENILPAVMLTSLVFGLQMINFSIPSTGSSGHIVGGLLLAVLLGPYSGFLAMCSIILVQALFFADGGLTALGCNIFNMGFLACFAAYPLVYKPLEKNKFAPIGLVEGVVSAAIIFAAQKTDFSKSFSYTTGGIALILAGVISNYASSKPDGLEWSLLNISNSFVAQTQGQIYSLAEALQAKTAVLTALPSVAANIIGLLAIVILMSVVTKLLTVKKAEVYEK